MNRSVTFLSLLLVLLSACSQESKVRSAVKTQVEEKFLQQVNQDFKGTEKSKVWKDLREFALSKTSVKIDDVKVEGDNASGTVSITSLETDTTAGLALILAFGASDLDKRGMGLKEAWEDLRKEDKRMPAMADYPIETKKFAFTATKNDGWKLKDYDLIKEKKKK